MEQILMEYLVNSLWQAPLLAGGAWVVLRTGRPGPRAQHGVWVAALVLMVAMPLLSLRGMPQGASGPVVAPVVAMPTVAMPEVESVGVQEAPTVARSSEMQNGAEDFAPWWRMREARLSAGATHRVVELYLAVVLFAMTRLLWSWIVASRMVAEASLVALNEAEMSLLTACCARLRVRQPRVLVSARTASPLIVGVLRPVLLLPEPFSGHNDRELEAVWWHELAHVRRRDYLANLVCRIWALPVAYHPVTQAVERRVRQTREMVCDQIAAKGMESPVGYARCLVGLAKRMQDHCGARELQATGMFGGGVLEERVMELIGKKTVESVQMRVVRTASGVAMLAMVMGAAAMFHVTPTMAQTALAGESDSVVLPVAALGDPEAIPTATPLPASPVVAAKADVQGASSAAPLVAEQAEAQVAARSRIVDGHETARKGGAYYQGWLDQDVRWIIHPDEREAFARLSNDEERDRFIENFWLRRDPAGAPENSYRAEHYLRIAYANQHFAAGSAGWMTERGRAYIVNGAPDAVEVFPSGINGDGHPAEVWHYRSSQGGQQVSMKFVDTCNCGEYRLQSSEGVGGNVPVKFMRPAVVVAYGPSLSSGLIRISDGAKGERLLAIADGGPLAFIGSLRMRGAMAQSSASGVAVPVPVQAQDATPTPKAVPADPAPQAIPSPTPHPKVFVQPQPAAGPQTPMAPKAPAPPMAPIAPRAPKAPLAPMAPLPPAPPLPPQAPAGKAQMSPNGDGFYLKLDPKWQLKLDAEMGAEREKLLEAEKRLNSPEFKKQMEDAQRAAAKVNTPEFQKQLAEAQTRAKEAMERMNTPEFKQKLMDAQRAKVNNPEFQKQLAEAGARAKETMDRMNTPEFRQQMEDAQKAAMKVNSAEFKEQMKEVQKQVKEAMEKMNTPEFRKQMQEMWAEPKSPETTESH